MSSTVFKNARTCTYCSGLPLGARPVFQASPKAEILVAGQAPGRKAHETGIPFDDASGDRLRHWMGVDRDTFYDPGLIAIVPMGFCYPGTGPSGDLPPRAECAPKWREAFLEALPNVSLTLVIGRYAKDYHIPESRKETLTATVSRWRHYWPSVVPLPHPSPRNNRWLARNPFFEQEVLPVLQERVQTLIA